MVSQVIVHMLQSMKATGTMRRQNNVLSAITRRHNTVTAMLYLRIPTIGGQTGLNQVQILRRQVQREKFNKRIITSTEQEPWLRRIIIQSGLNGPGIQTRW